MGLADVITATDAPTVVAMESGATQSRAGVVTGAAEEEKHLCLTQ